MILQKLLKKKKKEYADLLLEKSLKKVETFFQDSLMNRKLHYRIIELFKSGQCQETVHAHSILNQQLHKVHSVQHQCVQHRLL